MVEIDFPRGGGESTSSKHPTERDSTKGAGKVNKEKKGLKRPRLPEWMGGPPASSSKPAKKPRRIHPNKEREGKTESDGFKEAFHRRPSSELLTEGVRGLGIVTEITETSITLEWAGGIKLHLLGNQISQLLNQNLMTPSSTHGATCLREIFSTGQSLAFKVLKAASPKSKGASKNQRALVTTCPYEVNSHMVLSSLQEGLVVNGAVASVEEKGALVDLGIANSDVKGFVPAEKLPSHYSDNLEELKVGQVLLFKVLKGRGGDGATRQRVIPLTGLVERGDPPSFQPSLTSVIGVGNQLMPGCLLSAQPVKWTSDGHLLVNLFEEEGEMKGLVRSEHLPPRLRQTDPAKMKTLRVVCLACQQNSPLLLLSAHPDIVSLSRVEKRQWRDDYKIGQRVNNCRVSEVDKQENVYFRVESQDGREPLITMKALRIHIDAEVEHAVGSEHTCRVIGHNVMERLVLVTTKKSVLRQKIISPEEARPGQLFSATVVTIKPNGLTVKLEGDTAGIAQLKGFVTKLHLPKSAPPDEGIKWQRGLEKGQRVQCRVLYYDEGTRKLILTAKPGLVELAEDEKVIEQLSSELVGQLSKGLVIKVMPESGSCLLGFFNRVVGLLRGSDAMKLHQGGGVRVGMVLKVRVSSVDLKTGRMMLDLGKEPRSSRVSQEDPTSTALASMSATSSSKLKTRRAKPFQVYQAKVVGPWPYGGTSSSTSAELLLPGGTVGRIHSCELPTLDENVVTPMDSFLVKNKGKSIEVKVICVGKPGSISKQGQEMMEEEYESSRFVECTMLPGKLSEGKRKLRLINYQMDFPKGEKLPAFIVPSHTTFTTTMLSHLCGEINPLFKFTSNSPWPKEEEGELPRFSNGQLVYGVVEGVNKTRRGKCVHLRFDQFEPAVESKVSIKRTPSKSVKKEECDGEKPKPTPLQDPGFDWSLAGYSMTDLANVALGAGGPISTSKKKERKAANSESMGPLPTIEGHPELAQSIAKQPNSSQSWIKYIDHFASRKELENARAIAERGLTSISYSEEAELLKLWTAYLKLEAAMGEKPKLKEVFARACAAMDSYTMHNQLLAILRNAEGERGEDVMGLFESTLKKFRHKHLDCWFLYADYLYEKEEVAKARELLQRALQCLDRKQHLAVLSRFAKMEYSHQRGDIERGRTMFEKILHTYPKRTEVWIAYVDALLKHKGIVEARKVYERAVLTASNPAQLYKKWLEAEKRLGDERSQNAVRERMLKHLDVLKNSDMGDE